MSFIYGLLVSFSPCVLVMIPILIKMCGSLRGAIFYLLGSIISYAILGVLLSSVGVYFQSVMHTWPVLLTFSLVLGYLSLSCFNLVRLPQYFVYSSNSFIIGLLGPILISPCMTPALGAIITLMIQKGCLECGILDLLLFGAGVNVPLVLSVFGLGKLLKRARGYFEWITFINGFLLIGLIVYLWM